MSRLTRSVTRSSTENNRMDDIDEENTISCFVDCLNIDRLGIERQDDEYENNSDSNRDSNSEGDDDLSSLSECSSSVSSDETSME